MNDDLLSQALKLAQEGIAIFPVNADKRPALKGWRQLATTDEDTIRGWFSGKWPGIGVPCGVEQDLICFDLDFGHTDDPERKQKLGDWLSDYDIEEWAESGGCIVRQTRSGGLHVIAAWPRDTNDNPLKSPRRIMPKLDVIIDGFYFVWAMDDGSYTQIAGGSVDTLEQASAPMLAVIEKGAGSDGSALMSAEEAHECMMSDGDEGQRHDALLRITQDWAQDHVGLGLRDLCDGCAAWIADMYEDQIDPDRFEQLTEWGIDERGEVRGELGRAMAGAFKLQPMSDELADAVRKKLEQSGQLSQMPLGTAAQKIAEKIDVPDDLPTLDWLNEDLPPPDWLIEGFIERGKIMGLAGTSNAGKTRWLAMLVACMSSGRYDIIGVADEAQPLRVMMVANEETELDLKRRVKATALANGLRMTTPITFCGQGWLDGKPHTQLLRASKEDRNRMVPNEPVVEAIVERALMTDAQVITFDPYVTLGVSNENAQAENNEMFALLRSIAERTGAAILFVHHAGRGESRTESPDTVRGLQTAFRGSSVITSSMDTGFTLLPFRVPEIAKSKEKRLEADEKIKAGLMPNYVVLDWAKSREGKMGAALFYVVEGYTLPEGYEIGVTRWVSEMEAKLSQQQAMFEHSIPGVEVDVGQVAQVLSETCKDGEIVGLRKMHKLLVGRVEGWPTAGNAPKRENKVVEFTIKMLTRSSYEVGGGKTIILVESEAKRGQNAGWVVRINAQ